MTSPGNAALARVATVDLSGLLRPPAGGAVVLSDVTNPLPASKQKINKDASYVGSKWSNERETSGRSGWTSSGWTPPTSWGQSSSSSWAWGEAWPKENDYLLEWTRSQHDMMVERRKKGVDKYVLVPTVSWVAWLVSPQAAL